MFEGCAGEGGNVCTDQDTSRVTPRLVGGVGIGDVLVALVQTDAVLVTMEGDAHGDIVRSCCALILHVDDVEARAFLRDDGTMFDYGVTSHKGGIVVQPHGTQQRTVGKYLVRFPGPWEDDAAFVVQQRSRATAQGRTHGIAVHALAMILVETACMSDAVGQVMLAQGMEAVAYCPATQCRQHTFVAEHLLGILAPDVVAEGTLVGSLQFRTVGAPYRRLVLPAEVILALGIMLDEDGAGDGQHGI